MKPIEQIWLRLATIARRAPAEEAGGPPPGFATRVVTRWQQSRIGETFWEGVVPFLAGRAVGAAGCMVLVSALYCWQTGALGPRAKGDFWTTPAPVEWEVLP